MISEFVCSKFARVTRPYVWPLPSILVGPNRPGRCWSVRRLTPLQRRRPRPPMEAKATGTKVGTINIEQAIFTSYEGRRDLSGTQEKV